MPGFGEAEMNEGTSGVPGGGRLARRMETIYVPFSTTKARGPGLGLPTAKRLIEAQRGTLSIQCPPIGGTTVTVQLPTP